MLRLISNDDTLQIYRFDPNLFCLFHGKLRAMNFHEIIRFLLMLVHGYVIYYLYLNGEEVGYSVVQKGGSFRYRFANKQDIISGPYFISSSFRRRGYSTYLLQKILFEFDIKYENAYCFISKNNIASCKTVEKLGFEMFSGGEY